MSAKAKPAWLPSAKRHIERLDIHRPKAPSAKRSGGKRSRRGLRWLTIVTSSLALLAAGFVVLHNHDIEAAVQKGAFDEGIAPEERDALDAIKREMGFLKLPAR